jgi:hypothetical protein
VERWGKIKKEMKKILESNGSSAISTPRKPAGTRASAGTPRTPANRVTQAAPGSAGSSSKKPRSQKRMNRDVESDDEQAMPHVPKREADALANEMGFATNPFAPKSTSGGIVAASRVQRAASVKANVNIKQEVIESEDDNSDSDTFGANQGAFKVAGDIAGPHLSLQEEDAI